MRNAIWCALTVAVITTWAQPAQSGARVAQFRSTADGTEQPYAIYTPRSYDPGRKYPLIVGLHEEESNHIAELKHIFHVPSRYGESALQNLMTLPTLPDVDFVVACPLARGGMGFQGVAEQDVYDMIADVKQRYAIDEDRMYLTGNSMGGGAALWMALTRPDLWAAVAPVAAAIVPGSEELAGNALDLPIRIFHGDQDVAVPVASSRQWQKRLLDLGVPVDYVEYPGVRHNAWDFAYRQPGLFEWFGRQQRNRMPDHVRFLTRWFRYNTAYWIRLDGFTPGTTASVDAVRNGGELRVRTQNLNAFTVTAPVKSVTVDGTAIRIRPGPTISLVKSGGRWGAGAAPVQRKRIGSEGPIVDAFRARQIWVYGTRSLQSEEELTRRRAEVESGAAWSTARIRLNLGTVIKADRDVTEDEIAGGNLVLFGTAETNALIARFAAQMPMSLSPGAADYGLVFIAPVGNRYVVVSSGLPWWSGADEVDRGGYRFAPEHYRLLSTFGDYLVFKGGLKRVMAEGMFDADWRLSPDQKEKLRATGVIAVR